MNTNFSKVKEFLLDLEYSIIQEDEKESVFVIEYEESGIKNLIIDCEDTLLVMEQYIFKIDSNNALSLKKLLQKNREIVHGAFVLDESGEKVLFRDTLELENLDKNELEASINSLAFLLTEYSEELLKIGK